MSFMRDKQIFNTSEEQEQEIKNHFFGFCVKNLVYWYFMKIPIKEITEL